MNTIISCSSNIAETKLPFLPFQKKVSKDILEICAPIFKALGITFFSQTRAFHDGHFTSLMTTTDLTEHYIERKYPIYHSQGHGITLDSGIYIAAHLETQPSQQKVQQELRNLFNVDHMIHLIDKQKDYDDMYSFATTPENYQMVNQFINNIDLVKHFILYYKDKSANHIKKSGKIKYSSEYFPLPATTIHSLDKNKDLFDEMRIKKIRISTKAGEINISQREFECLKYVARNYTFKEIAKFLDLSPRTVETYINNLKFKLGCDSRTALINIATDLDLL